ncbi:MAG: TlpA family protein disulfide reductase [Actinomycetota bacterium]|nr:TlpA family protein disulfide reductase [Actinomycetota bacterium]MDQ3592213.1 TlpA family protein disulfide reductase [Actinomycetota bacterium]
MHRAGGLAGSVAVSALVLGACAAPSTGDAEPAQGGLSAPVYEGPELDQPVFDVPCTRDGSPEAAESVTSELPRVVLDCLGPGPAVDTADLAGQVVVVNFWASWCDPCREEMPMLASVAEDTGDGVRFIGVNTKDQPEAAADFLESTGVRFEQLYDPDGELLRQLRTVQGLPVTLVLDADGAIALRHIGQIDQATLLAALEALP